MFATHPGERGYSSMAAIFPPADKGGVPPGPNVVNGYTPGNAVIGEGPLYASSDCTTIFTAGQLNALTSEILAAVDILGFAYNANSITNLGGAIKARLDAVSTGYVDVSGDTMTGPLILSGAPTDPNGAATKDYVDDGLEAAANAVADTYVVRAGDTMTGPLTLSGSPIDPLHAATKAYVDLLSIGDAPFDSHIYGRFDGAWVRTLEDAPANGNYYARRNNLWEPIAGGGGGTVPEAPVDGKVYGRKNALWVRAVEASGDKMSGDLEIEKADPALLLDKTAASGQNVLIRGQRGGLNRWTVVLGSSVAEGGANSGSEFTLNRHDDAGNAIGSVLFGNRVNGLLSVAGDPTTATGIATKQYVDTTATAAAATKLSKVSDDTSTGNFTISKNMPVVFLNRTDTNASILAFAKNGNHEFNFRGQDGDFVLWRFNPVSPFNALNTPFVVNHASGTVSLGTAGVAVQLTGGANITGSMSYGVGAASNAQCSVNGGSGGATTGYGYYFNKGGTLHYIMGSRSVIAGDGSDNFSIFNSGVNFAFEIGKTDSLITCAGFMTTRGYYGKQGENGASSAQNWNFYWTGSALQGWVQSLNCGNVTFSSDYRIKKDVVDLPPDGMWDRVKALRPISYTQAEYSPQPETPEQPLPLEPPNLPEGVAHSPPQPRAEPETGPIFEADNITRWGFIAHELQQTLIPSAATGFKDIPNAVQSPNPWTIIACLTKVIQEMQTRIEALETAAPP
jgi:Chaperone of endosialidase